jgi:ATP-dependent helicase/nuclease subunit B
MACACRLPELPMPTRMSPSAYRALRTCPYQYYVRSLLGLRKRKSLDEELDASLLGQTLHQILRNFFQELKTTQLREQQLRDLHYRRAWMLEHLQHASEQGFAKLLDGDKRILGSLRDWQKQIPSFIAWQLNRETQGWQFHDAELKVGFEFTFTDTNHQEHTIRIEGYADRVDVSEIGQQAAVLDYKYQNRDKIKKRAEQLMDDPQLLLYTKALAEEKKIIGHTVTDADWVALKVDLKKKDPTERSLSVDDLVIRGDALDDQLQQDLSAVWSGSPMQAFAPDSVCRHCEARGICRKGMW